jgi:hypothetical protein
MSSSVLGNWSNGSQPRKLKLLTSENPSPRSSQMRYWQTMLLSSTAMPSTTGRTAEAMHVPFTTVPLISASMPQARTACFRQSSPSSALVHPVRAPAPCCLWIRALPSCMAGFALRPEPNPSLLNNATSVVADMKGIRDLFFNYFFAYWFCHL